MPAREDRVLERAHDTSTSLKDGSESFDVTRLEARAPTRIVLFAVGGGGNPDRHRPLFTSLTEQGCTVVAPRFDRLLTPRPTEEHLVLRARRLKLALDAVARPGLVVAGVGHSIGAASLLALAGGHMWMRRDAPLAIEPDSRIDRLVLLAPATGFFQAPKALDRVCTPILAWAGTADGVTPPAEAKLLKDVLEPRVPVDLRIVEGAGHFSFLHEPPPQTSEPLPDRDAFLAALTAEVVSFVTS